MKFTFKIIVINLIVLSALIVSIEIIAQLTYRIKYGDFLPFVRKTPIINSIFEMHPYLVGRPKSSVTVTQNNKTITTTHFNTRWTGAEHDNHNLVRIAILGGSTAFGTGVSDKDSWPALLQAKLGKQYEVINYGVPGYSTAENIIQMALIVPEKQPHIVIFYEGWNDIKNYHEKKLGPDYYEHGMRQFAEFGRYSVIEQPAKFQSLSKLNIFATVWWVNKKQKEMTTPEKKAFESFDKPDPYVDDIYLRNLKTLKLLSEKIDAFALFVPQVLNYSNFYKKVGSARGWTRYIKDEAMPGLMDKFNSHMDGLCFKQEKSCVVLKAVLEENWLPIDFVDAGHMSRSGGLKFSEIIAQSIFSIKYDEGTYQGSTQQIYAPNS
jgi:hypothetical protein